MDVIDVLGDLLIDLERTAASSPTVPRAKGENHLQSKPSPYNTNSPLIITTKNEDYPKNATNTKKTVEKSFLYAPDKDIITGLPLVNTLSPGPLSPRVPSPRPVSALSTTSNETSTGDVTLGVNDIPQDSKFQSYHLDYKYTPPPIKGPCCVCGDGIMGAMVTALDCMWHPEHFCCVNCGIELRSPMYLEHDGKPYCKICHGKLFLPPCYGCKKDITGNYIKAMGSVWHPACFQCTRCRKVLPADNFFQKDGKPYCEDDFHELFSPKCSHCKKPIKDDRKISDRGRQFHPGCFKCCECGIQLHPPKYKEKNGKFYCEKDYNNLFMPKCAGCSTPVVSDSLSALGKNWHPPCFRCTECKKQLDPEQFLEKEGKPYCLHDYHRLFSPKCGQCNQPIKDDRKISANGGLFHPGCFKCCECGIQLHPPNYKEKNGKFYCEKDYNNLFMPKCAGCSTPVVSNPVSSMGKTWHHSCSPRCAACSQPIRDKFIFAMNQHYHPEHFTCTMCKKPLKENEFFENEGRIYCEDDFLEMFAPRCCACKKPIKEEYCLFALEGDWHKNCFRCKDCGCLLEDKNFYEIDGQPYCETHFEARQCPDCVKMRRAQNKYFGLPLSTPMGMGRWASQVSLKSLTESTTTVVNNVGDGGMQNGYGNDSSSRPVSQLSQYSTNSYDTAYTTDGGGRSSPSVRSYIIPIEREGGGVYRNGGETGHFHDEGCKNTHSHEHSQPYSQSAITRTVAERYQQSSNSQSQRSSLKRGQSQNDVANSGELGSRWSNSLNNLQYIAKNENPYNYLEPGKFPVESKHIRFSDQVTKREFDETEGKYY